MDADTAAEHASEVEDEREEADEEEEEEGEEEEGEDPLAIEGTRIGGYGEVSATALAVGANPDWTAQATLRRVELSVAHNFSDLGLPIGVYSEFEWENAVVSSGSAGTVEVEQARLDLRLGKDDDLRLRAGLLIVPMGILNQHHEAPEFNGVERPSLDLVLIPSTWRELGVGFAGESEHLEGEIYAMTGLDPSKFSDLGIVGGRTLGSLSPATALAGAGRLVIKPIRLLALGISAYASQDGGALPAYDADGERIHLSIPVLGAEADLQAELAGFELRAVGVGWSLPQSDDLMEARKADGSPYFPDGTSPVPTRMLGGYVEAAYDVLHPFDARSELLAFARLEHDDTQAAVPEGTTANPLRTWTEYTFGVSWRAAEAVALKADTQLRDRKYGDDEIQVDLGLGYRF